MTDAIFVNGLVLHAYHGVMPHEGKVGQPFVLDLILDIDLTEASRTDKLKHTVSYELLVKTASEGSVRAATGWWKRPRAPSPTLCSIAIRGSAASASLCASRMRPLRRHSTMSA